MTDTSFSSASLRLQRGRNPSAAYGTARNSTNYDDGSLRLPSVQAGGGGHSLRSVSSRFSLGEHFAATRSLYEFGFDDASSYAAPSILAPEETSAKELHGHEEGEEERREVERMLEGDLYDVLNLPREGALTREEVRRAYHRMFLLFYPEMYPPAMQEIARKQFERAQEGFEVLTAARMEADLAEDGDREGVVGTRTDVGVRLDAAGASLRPLDFTVGHATSLPLPTLTPSSLHAIGLKASTPTLTLSSSIYGIIPPMAALPIHLLASPHQPLRPATSPRHRLLQLMESKLSPVIGASVSQEIVNESAYLRESWLGTRAEYGLDILPHLAPSARLFHHLDILPDARHPTVLETSFRGQTSTVDGSTRPGAAVGIQQPFDFGTAFLRVDSGDWTLTPDTYRFLASPASSRSQARELRYADFPLAVAPTVELGVTSSDAWEADSWRDTPESGRRNHLSVQRKRSKHGTWTASATVQPLHDLTTSILYASPSLSSLSSSYLEIDLSASTIHPANLSVRHLLPITASTNFGLELSVSRFSTHLSLHISRLNQRFSLPILLPPAEHVRPLPLFLASAIPFLALAAYRFLTRRTRASSKSQEGQVENVLGKLDASSPTVQAAIARKREEADQLTGLLAQPVATRQKHHASQGGLVILSAKLGVSDSPASPFGSDTPTISLPTTPAAAATFHPDYEIADVTVALAALVDDQTGKLRIPAGVRKGCIPGFWDPAPGREKLLLVRYSWRGKEDILSAEGNAEVVLPPR